MYVARMAQDLSACLPLVQALAWLDEVNVVYLNGYYSVEQAPLYGELSMNFMEDEEI